SPEIWNQVVEWVVEGAPNEISEQAYHDAIRKYRPAAGDVEQLFQRASRAGRNFSGSSHACTAIAAVFDIARIRWRDKWHCRACAGGVCAQHCTEQLRRLAERCSSRRDDVRITRRN